MADMKLRRAATQKTVDRYRGKAFDWGRGVTCVHMARAHLRNMGHKVPAIPRFRSAFGAKAALADRGWADCCEMLDSMLPRIAPAFATLGDLVVLPGETELGLDAICMTDGRGNIIGWHGAADGGPSIIKMAASDVIGAWRL